MSKQLPSRGGHESKILARGALKEIMFDKLCKKFDVYDGLDALYSIKCSLANDIVKQKYALSV